MTYQTRSSHIISLRGIKTGEADSNQDGKITAEELFTYTSRFMKKVPQIPAYWADGRQYELVIANNPRAVAHLRGKDHTLASTVPPVIVRSRISPESAGAVKFLLALTSSEAIQPPDINAVERPSARYRVWSQLRDDKKSPWEQFKGLVKEGVTLLGYDDKADTNDVFDVTFAPDGSTLAAAMGDKTVRLWRASDGMLLSTLKGHQHKVTGVAYSPDGTTLASGSLDGTILLWSLPDSAQFRRLGKFGQYDRFADFAEEQKTVNVVQWSPNGQLIAGGYGDGKVRLWDGTDGKLLFVLEGHKDHVSDLAFSPDSRTLASVAYENIDHKGNIKLWNVDDGSCQRILETDNQYNCVAFSPNGKMLVAGGESARYWSWTVPFPIDLWDPADGTLLRRFAHVSTATCIAFSSTGEIVATGSTTGEVYLTTVSSLDLPGPLRFIMPPVKLFGHKGDITRVVFSPNDTLIATSSDDQTVRLWGVA